MADVLDFTPFKLGLQELDSYFGELDAAVGVRAQNYAGVGGGGVFDDLASHEMHMARRDPAYRGAVRKRTLVELTLATVGAANVRVLSTALTPRRWDGDGGAPERALREALRFGKTKTTLLAVAVEPRLFRVYLLDKEVASDDDRTLARYTAAVDAAETSRVVLGDLLVIASAVPAHRLLDDPRVRLARDAALILFRRALRAYDDARLARIDAARDMRRAAIAADVSRRSGLPLAPVPPMPITPRSDWKPSPYQRPIAGAGLVPVDRQFAQPTPRGGDDE